MMDWAQHATVTLALVWLIGSMLLMMRSIRRGRALAVELALRHPDVYEALGKPRPGYLDSARRDRFARFIARREYETLSDPVLAARFEDYRRAEARTIVAIFAAMVAVCLLALAVGLPIFGKPGT